MATLSQAYRWPGRPFLVEFCRVKGVFSKPLQEFHTVFHGMQWTGGLNIFLAYSNASFTYFLTVIYGP